MRIILYAFRLFRTVLQRVSDRRYADQGLTQVMCFVFLIEFNGFDPDSIFVFWAVMQRSRIYIYSILAYTLYWSTISLGRVIEQWYK